MMIYWFLDLDLLKNKPFLPMRALYIKWRWYYFLFSLQHKVENLHSWLSKNYSSEVNLDSLFINKSSGKNKRFTAKGRWNKDWTCRGRIMTRTCSSRQVCFSEVVTNSIPSPIVQACVRCTSACAHMYSAWRAHRSQCEVDRADSISLLCLPLFFSAPRSDDSPLSLWFAVACGWEHEAVRRRN